MKSIKTKEPFTMEDFEKGLMLAGFITPASTSELHDREVLEEYERSSDNKQNNVFFQRVTLAAEIAFQLHSESTFGRIKFQKLVYLCEHSANMNLNDRYAKQVAGPFDNKFMHSIESQFKKNKWFEVEKIKGEKYTRSVYKPLDNIEGYKKFYTAYFKDHLTKIQYLIDLFRKLKTDTAEIAATLYACIIELKNEKSLINEHTLLAKFYTWSDAKTRFKRETVLETWEWMKEKGLIPVGINKVTD